MKKKVLFSMLMLSIAAASTVTVKASVFDTQKIKSEKSGTKVIAASSPEVYYSALTDLIDSASAYVESSTGDPDYESARLIVRTTSDINLSVYEGTACVIKGTDGTNIIQYHTNAQAKKAAAALKGRSGVAYVEPDQLMHICDGTAADTEIYEAEAYDAEVSDLSAETSVTHWSWGIDMLGCDSYGAYAKSINTSTITIAVVDTGVDRDHSALEKYLKRGYDFVDGDTSPEDENGHGTHVSGTIIDCTKKINRKILPVRVLDAEGNGWLSVCATGIRYAADNGASVINMSFGGPHSSEVDNAISYALKKGVVCVAAAGNESTYIGETCPAHVTSLITVGAIDSEGQQAWFSNYGSALDLVAPGEDIYSTYLYGGYGYMSGTSQATPHVSGCAALILTANPSYTPKKVQSVLKSICVGSSGHKDNIYYGSGRPNLTKLLPEYWTCSHSMTHYNAVEATCETSGRISYYKCSKCNYCFTNSAGTKTVKESKTVIPALGHDMSDLTVYTVATRDNDGSILRQCTRSGCTATSGEITTYAIETMSLSVTDYTYTGKLMKPAVLVLDREGQEISNEFYTVSYDNNQNAGIASVTIVFTNAYSGYETLSFEIHRAPLPEVSLKSKSLAYTGKRIRPAVVFSSGAMASGTDYKLTYSSTSPKVGTYKVKVTGIGNYTGSKSLTYKIVPSKPAIKSLTPGSRKMTVVWTKNAAECSGYEIQYSTKSTFSKSKSIKIVGRTKYKKTIKQLNARTKYYVRVRAYKTKNGVTYYSSWSSRKYTVVKY